MPVRLAAPRRRAGHRQRPYPDRSLRCHRLCRVQADCLACWYRDGETNGLGGPLPDGDRSAVGVGGQVAGAVPDGLDEVVVGAGADELTVGVEVCELTVGVGAGELVAGAGGGEGVAGGVVAGEVVAGAGGGDEDFPAVAGAGTVDFAGEATGQVALDVSVYTGCVGVTVVEATGVGVVETAGVEVVEAAGVGVFGAAGVEVFGVAGVEVFGVVGVDVFGTAAVEVSGAVGVEVFGVVGVEVSGAAGAWVFGAAEVGVAEAAGTGASAADGVAAGGALVWLGCALAVTGSALDGHAPAGGECFPVPGVLAALVIGVPEGLEGLPGPVCPPRGVDPPRDGVPFPATTVGVPPPSVPAVARCGPPPPFSAVPA